MNIQWYPGHMTKTRRQIQADLKLVDLVAEIIDARIPISSRNPDIDELVGEKPRLIVLNRADQADPAMNKAWSDWFRKKGWSVLETNARDGKGVGQFSAAIKTALKEKLEQWKAKGLVGRPVRAMVVGVPNVGKSTFINKVAKRKSAKASDRPGVTRGKQWVTVDRGLELLDTPGILWPKFEDVQTGLHLAFTGAVKNSFLSVLNICAFVVFFTVVIQLLIRSGLLPALAGLLGTLLAPFGLTPEWAQRLLTGALELSTGVTTLIGDGSLSGRLVAAAFMLGWAGISVHCQVLSFLGGSGLSAGTYLAGKLLHGGLSALFTAALVRLFPLEAPVSDYLAEQVAGIAGMEFHSTLVISTVCAWVLFLAFLFTAAAGVRKGLGKGRRPVL